MRSIAYLVNTFLRKSEGFIYEQVANIKDFNVEVLTREHAHRSAFPYANVNAFPDSNKFAYHSEFLKYTLFRHSGFFEKTIVEKKISLIHAHFGVEGVYALPLKERFGLPLFVTFHGQDITRLPKFTLFPPAWLNYWLGFDELKARGDVFLAVSDYIRKNLIAKGFPTERLKTHYLGINTDLEPGNLNREKAVLTVGRLVEKKGTKYLIQAMGEIAKKDREIKLWICGEGPLKAKLQALVSELKLQDRVLFLGWKSKEEVFSLMRKCRLFSLPSITASDGDGEGLGMAILEAMVHGLPAIGTRHGGIPEIVRDGENGFLVPEKDHRALAEKINALMSDEKLALQMGAQGRAIAQHEFDIKKQVRELEKMYGAYLGVSNSSSCGLSIKPKVSIITPDFSHNCVGRAYLIAELLKEDFRIEIVGPALKGNVWYPIEDKPQDIEYKYVAMTKKEFLFGRALELAKMVSGDIVIISKSVFPSIFVGLTVKLFRRTPLIVDIDDWEFGFELDRFQNFKQLDKKVISLFQMVKLSLCEIAARMINKKIVSNSYLRGKFSGYLLPHVRDTDRFDPDKYSKDHLRRAYGIPEAAKMILFLGTPREHKGLGDLFSSFKRITRQEALLVIVGFDLNDSAHKKIHDEINAALGNRCRLYSQQPFEKIPEFLAMADIVVIPQKECFSSRGQIPAKLFDAMAMGKAIVASRINDIPAILDSCGLLYEPGNIDELSDRLEKLLSAPEQLSDLGNSARERCVKEYSYAAEREKLSKQVRSALR